MNNPNKLTAMDKAEKLKKLNAEIVLINKDFGANSVMSLSDKPQNTESISTGSLSLDTALGIGGLPCGRIVEIFGPESSGKTTIATHVIAEAQKKGGVCAFVDVEHAFDSDYAAKLGVNIDELKISQPDWGEQALEIVDRLIETGGVDVVVVDSVAAIVPKRELEGEMGDSVMGLHARLMSQACRKLVASVSRTGTLLIFINQLREKIGVMFGNPETTTGGRSLAFYASVRLDVRKTSTNKDGDESVSNTVKVKVVKNKVAPPFRVAEFDIVFGEGIDRIGELLKVGRDLGIVKQSGAWVSYGDVKAQGGAGFKTLLRDNPELAAEIAQRIKAAIYENLV
jgi:recombination protein RecA